MMERPILFSGPMVRAILDGRKTMTRRVVKMNLAGRVELRGKQWHIDDPNAILACPYGRPGDLLWVRETWFCEGRDLPGSGLHYRANAVPADERWFVEEGWKWKPSIHMPRWASRLLLRVTEVRVERLWEITQEDAIAEGIERIGDRFKGYMRLFTGEEYNPALPKTSFAQLWETINAKRGYGWDSNPWVWVVSFEVMK